MAPAESANTHTVPRRERFDGALTGATSNPHPPIEAWIPAEADGPMPAVVILPGGGYQILAEHEGRGYAEFMAAHGVAAFVASYRLAPDGFRHPAMLEDALAALAAVRRRAADFGVRADAIGIMGSSAGGHLAAHVLVAHHSYAADVSLCPDFGILCYAVTCATGPHAPPGSFRNLLGEQPPEGLIREVDVGARVSADTAPCFLWHTVADETVPVENSLTFAASLRNHGVPFELHVYPHGRHGLGLDTPFAWGAACVRWIGETTRTTDID